MRLSGRHVVLRDEPGAGDDDDMFRWLNMEDWAYFDHPDRAFEPISREDYDGRLRRRESGAASSVWKRLQIDTTEGEHIGWINCYEYDEAIACTRVGICVPCPGDRGKGRGTEALGLLLRHLFEDLALHEVRLNTWTGNTAMVRCALKAGFEEVSRSPHRAPVSVRGEPLERIDLAISWSRWNSHRSRHE
jgi:RimJ/RimL family protein N-acetyltransferase